MGDDVKITTRIGAANGPAPGALSQKSPFVVAPKAAEKKPGALNRANVLRAQSDDIGGIVAALEDMLAPHIRPCGAVPPIEWADDEVESQMVNTLNAAAARHGHTRARLLRLVENLRM